MGAELRPPDGLERQYRFPVVIRRYLAFEFPDRDLYFDAFHIFLHGFPFPLSIWIGIQSYRLEEVLIYPTACALKGFVPVQAAV